MARSPYSSKVAPETLFGKERPSGFRSSQFWLSMGRYRPILLVGGVWLVLICLAAFAYNRLMFTGTPPEPVAGSGEVQAQSPSSTSPNSELTFGTTRSEASASERAFTSAPVDSLTKRQPEQLVPAWSVGLLVGICALSCFGISTGVQASRRRSKRAALKPKAPNRSLAAVKPRRRLPAPAQPVRLSPYSAERDGVLVPTATQGRPRSPQSASPSKARIPRRSKRVPPALTPPPQVVTGNLARKVAVVPEGQPHPLDWQESSLADNLDLRQRRSLSSLL